jgi:hypothetical protein
MLIVFAAFLLLVTSAIYAQPVRSGAYTGTPAGTSSGNVLWSQLDEPTGSAFTDQAFEASYAAYDSWGGDDFTIAQPASPGTRSLAWALDQLFTPGSVTVAGSSPFFMNIAFYEDGGGIPGAVVSGCDFPANTSFTSAGDGDLTVDVSGCELDMGTKWFSQQVRMDFNPVGQHYWATKISANENPGVWKNPGDGFGNGCTDWQPANAVCGMNGEDFLFELSGTAVETQEGAPAVGPVGALLLLLALGGGSAYVLRRRR